MDILHKTVDLEEVGYPPGATPLEITIVTFCLVPRPLSVFHLGRSVSGHVVRFPRPFVSDTSPKRIHREGLGESRTGTRQRYIDKCKSEDILKSTLNDDNVSTDSDGEVDDMQLCWKLRCLKLMML